MLHSVVLEERKCRGCTTCIKSCPTEAIRVRNGKAIILDDRCIDCGICIQVCPHKAIKSLCDSLSDLEKFKYTVALPITEGKPTSVEVCYNGYVIRIKCGVSVEVPEPIYMLLKHSGKLSVR